MFKVNIQNGKMKPIKWNNIHLKGYFIQTECNGYLGVHLIPAAIKTLATLLIYWWLMPVNI
jgi:hypothetical protein